MTTTEALELHRGDRIRVKRSTSSRSRLAVVTGNPWRIDRWVLVQYAVVKYDADKIGSETLSAHDNIATVPTDSVVRA